MQAPPGSPLVGPAFPPPEPPVEPVENGGAEFEPPPPPPPPVEVIVENIESDLRKSYQF